MNNVIVRILTLTLLIVNLFYYSKIINQDIFLVKSLYQDISNKDFTSKVLFGLPYYEPAEKVAVGYYNFQLKQGLAECDTIIRNSQRLLEINSRSSQAYYGWATCAEVNGDLSKSMDLIQRAVSYDPLNTVYLSGEALLNISIGNKTQASSILERILFIDPNEPRIYDIEALLTQ